MNQDKRFSPSDTIRALAITLWRKLKEPISGTPQEMERAEIEEIVNAFHTPLRDSEVNRK